MDQELESKSKRMREIMVYSKLEKPFTAEMSQLLQSMAEMSAAFLERSDNHTKETNQSKEILLKAANDMKSECQASTKQLLNILEQSQKLIDKLSNENKTFLTQASTFGHALNQSMKELQGQYQKNFTAMVVAGLVGGAMASALAMIVWYLQKH